MVLGWVLGMRSHLVDGDNGADCSGCKSSTIGGYVYVEIVHMIFVKSKGTVGGDPP